MLTSSEMIKDMDFLHRQDALNAKTSGLVFGSGED